MVDLVAKLRWFELVQDGLLLRMVVAAVSELLWVAAVSQLLLVVEVAWIERGKAAEQETTVVVELRIQQ